MTIKQKQCLLCYLGYYTGQIDGIWGPKSETAAAEFHRENPGLTLQEAISGLDTREKSSCRI